MIGYVIGIGIAVLAFFVWCMCKSAATPTPSPYLDADDEDYSVATHRAEGTYRVLYNDGFLSQPFMPKTAYNYATHFGGIVVPRNYNGPHRVLPGGAWVNLPAQVS